jgi:hypothetical protein
MRRPAKREISLPLSSARLFVLARHRFSFSRLLCLRRVSKGASKGPARSSRITPNRHFERSKPTLFCPPAPTVISNAASRRLFCPRPTVISNAASRRLFFYVRSCERVGLRREKSLLLFLVVVRGKQRKRCRKRRRRANFASPGSCREGPASASGLISFTLLAGIAIRLNGCLELRRERSRSKIPRASPPHRHFERSRPTFFLSTLLPQSGRPAQREISPPPFAR